MSDEVAPQPGAEPAASGKKSKSFKYSKGPLATAQKLERGFVRSQHRLVKAVEAGLESWRTERDKSARKKKDGALHDIVQNAAEAFTATMREASEAPRDALKSFSPKLKPKKILDMFVPPNFM